MRKEQFKEPPHNFISNKEKMRYTGHELFMEKLKNMIYSNDNPLITNNPSILSERPQFKLIYQELDSMIRTLHLIDDEHRELQQLTDLKKRFKDAAEDAHHIIDVFVYTINLGYQISLNQVFLPPAPEPNRSKGRCFSGLRTHVRLRKLVKNEKITLKDVGRSIQSIKKEFIRIHAKLKMDSSPISAAATRTFSPKTVLGTKKANEEDIVVGFDRHVEQIRDKLTEDFKHLDMASIVGMGGLGKTTLATKLFNDPFVMYHFHVRGWVTVSQTYDKQNLLIQILESIGNKADDLRNDDYSQLRQMLRQQLMGKRYLIVIDDIWSNDAWDGLKLSFPDDNNGSRILLTSRLKEVALHAKSHGFIHQLQYLTGEESWELLCKKVFRGNDCPESLIEPGMQIAKNCHGLPLTLVVIAGVLANKTLSKDSWERISRSVSSYVVSGQTEYIQPLALSFDHLPGHLRDCFLYLGGFPEDYKFRVQHLIWLWVAEGFIQEDGSLRSLEEIAEDYLNELVDRNLVVVAKRKSKGSIKAFNVHDLLRELCLKIARKENFFLKAQRGRRLVEEYRQRCLFIESGISLTNAPRIRSLLCVDRINDTRKLIGKWSHFWMLLMVLDLRGWERDYFPEEISQLVFLRYLAMCDGGEILPVSICKLWSLQTLIIRCDHNHIVELPKTISNLVNLRHLICEGYSEILFPAIERPMNLQTISRTELEDGVESWAKCFPDIKKLACNVRTYMQTDFESLTSLEILMISQTSEVSWEPNLIRLPTLLKSLTLNKCRLCWSDMSIIQALPNLEVLKLLYNSFEGPHWDVGEEQFQQLKFLKLHSLEIQQWEASSINFPCLKQLVVVWCFKLEEIPLDLGNIPTLELISITKCNDSVMESVDMIKEDQHAQGNFDLKITAKKA